MRFALAIFGMAAGLYLILAAALRWRLPLAPTPPGNLAQSSPGYVRAFMMIAGAVAIVLGLLILTGTI